MKLIGNTDVEDSLRRLDDLTNEEALMASAELHRRIHSVDNGVQGVKTGLKDVDDRVQSVHGKVESINKGLQDLRDTVQAIDDKVQGVHSEVYQGNRQYLVLISLLLDLIFLTGNHLRDSFRTWLSPPNPSINHKILCDAHHEGTTEWFSGGKIFNDWKSIGSCLWIHGKRAFFSAFCTQPASPISKPIAGSGKSVLWFVLSLLLPVSRTK